MGRRADSFQFYGPYNLCSSAKLRHIWQEHRKRQIPWWVPPVIGSASRGSRQSEGSAIVVGNGDAVLSQNSLQQLSAFQVKAQFLPHSVGDLHSFPFRFTQDHQIQFKITRGNGGVEWAVRHPPHRLWKRSPQPELHRRCG